MVCNAKIGKAFFHLSKEIRGLRRQIFSEARSVRDDDPVSFILGVENAQGIAVQAAAAVFFFFFKQKTAYEILRSDWSSDVCSSDLNGGEEAVALVEQDDAPDTQL